MVGAVVEEFVAFDADTGVVLFAEAVVELVVVAEVVFDGLVVVEFVLVGLAVALVVFVVFIGLAFAVVEDVVFVAVLVLVELVVFAFVPGLHLSEFDFTMTPRAEIPFSVP